jgi:molybdopterin converting factor subunit 1
MKINILFFATLRDKAKTKITQLTLNDGITVADLKKELAIRFPEIATSLPTTIVSRNKEFAESNEVLKDGDEVAVFPPVSGGD